jgi:putative transposase
MLTASVEMKFIATDYTTRGGGDVRLDAALVPYALARGAAVGIKPGVERSETPGTKCKKTCKVREAADRAGTMRKRLNMFDNFGHQLSKRPNMSDSYTNLLYHIVFSTKERRPLITPEYEPRLYEYIGGTIRGLGGLSPELNGTEDHVHLLAKLRPDRALSDVLRKLKANATGWMHDVFPAVKDFSWQRGYGAFTVSQSNVEEVRKYLRRQKEHHTKVSFRDEFIQFLRANDIEYDERYF